MKDKQTTMHARHAVTASLAQCVAIIDGERINLMQAIDLEAKAQKNKKELAILGKMAKGSKTVGVKFTGKCKFYLNTPIFIKQLERLKNTGEDLYFDIIVENEDESAQIGKQTVILKDVNIDEATIAKFSAEEDYLTDEVNFTYEDFIVRETFKPLNGSVI